MPAVEADLQMNLQIQYQNVLRQIRAKERLISEAEAYLQALRLDRAELGKWQANFEQQAAAHKLTLAQNPMETNWIPEGKK